MNKTINLHVEIECKDDSVDKGLVADFICKTVVKKIKKVNGVIVYDGDKLKISYKKKKS